MTSIKTAAVLVGGMGTRLQSLVNEVPKPLAPIAGRPFLDHILCNLKRHELQTVVLLTGYLSEQFSSYEKRSAEFGLKIVVSPEPTPLGTAGALKNAEGLLNRSSSFLLVNGDTFFEGDLKKLLRPLAPNESGRLGLCWMDNASRFGLITKESDGKITHFCEKKKGTFGWVNSGFAILNSSLLERIPKSKICSLEEDVYPHLEHLTGIELEGSFFDIGLPESYAEFNSDLILRSAFRKSKLLGHMLATWFQGGQFYVDEALKNYAWPEALRPQFFSGETIHQLTNLSSKDLVVSATPSVLKNSCLQINVSDSKPIESALNQWRHDFNNLYVSKGRHALHGLPWRPGLFIDIQAAIGRSNEFALDPKEVQLNFGLAELVHRAHEKKWAVVLLVSQPAVGLGLISWATFDQIIQQTLRQLAQKGAFVDQTICSVFNEKSQRSYGLVNAGTCLSSGGMFWDAIKNLRIDLSQSVVIGSDHEFLQAGIRAGPMKAYFQLRPSETNLANQDEVKPPILKVDNFDEVRL